MVTWESFSQFLPSNYSVTQQHLHLKGNSCKCLLFSLSALQMHDTLSISFLVYYLTFLSNSSFITLCLFPAYKVTMAMGITLWSQTILPIIFEMPLLDFHDTVLWCYSNPGLGIHTDIMQSEITFCIYCLVIVTAEVPVFALRALGSHQAGWCGLLYSCCAI